MIMLLMTVICHVFSRLSCFSHFTRARASAVSAAAYATLWERSCQAINCALCTIEFDIGQEAKEKVFLPLWTNYNSESKFIHISVSAPSLHAHLKVGQRNGPTMLYLSSVGKWILVITVQFFRYKEAQFHTLQPSQMAFVRPISHSHNAHVFQMPSSRSFPGFCVCFLSKGLSSLLFQPGFPGALWGKWRLEFLLTLRPSVWATDKRTEAQCPDLPDRAPALRTNQPSPL